MIPNIKELSETYKGHQNMFDKMNVYKWPIQLSSSSEMKELQQISGTSGSQYTSEMVFLLQYQEGFYPVSGRCEIRVSIEVFGENFSFFKSVMHNISYSLLFGDMDGEHLYEHRLVRSHPLIRALLKDTFFDYNDSFSVDEVKGEYVFNFPLLFDCFVCGSGFDMPRSQRCSIKIVNALHCETKYVCSKVFVNYRQGQWIGDDIDIDRPILKKIRCFNHALTSVKLHEYFNLNIDKWFLGFCSSGIFFQFYELTTNKPIYGYDFLESVTVIFDNHMQFWYEFNSSNIYGACKKFAPYEWCVDKKPSIQTLKSFVSQTGLPKEVWVNIIKFLPCVVDLKNLLSTCSALHLLGKSQMIRNSVSRLPGWYCIPFNDDSEYDTSSKGYYVNLSRVDKINFSFHFSITSNIYKKFVGKDIGVVFVNSCYNISFSEHDMMVLRYVR